MLATYFAYSKNDAGGFAIYTPEQNYPRRIEGAPRVEGVNAEAWSFAPHASTALVMTNLWFDRHWYPRDDKPTGQLTGDVEAEAVAVRTVCDPSVREIDHDTSSLDLPNLPAYDTWSPGSSQGNNFARVRLFNGTLGQNSTASLFDNQNMTTVFIPLGSEVTSVTTGLVILGPTSSNGRRFSLVCSVDARWNKALHIMTKSEDYGIGNVGNTITAQLHDRRKKSDLSKSTLPLRGTSWRPIAAEPAWLQAALGYTTRFNLGYPPYAIDAHGPTYKTTALGALLMARLKHLPKADTTLGYWINNTNAAESVISTAFADAISRIGIERQQTFNGYTPIESVRSCQQITNRYTFCPPPTAAVRDQWTRLSFTGSTAGTCTSF
ncbi:MAG: hypothetical protein Q9220_005182 [cf. Caloplaca sp. 1 TL-2023]